MSFELFPKIDPMVLLKNATESFAIFFILFFPLEKVFPAKKNQKFFRPEWFLDLCFFLGQYLLWSLLVTKLLLFSGSTLQQHLSEGWLKWVASRPLWLQMIAVIFLSDLFVYWGHRLQHRVNFLWRFHSVHHTSKHLDWLAAHREHPIDTVYTMGLINLPVFLLGFPVETLTKLIIFRGIWAIFIHSNTRIPIGPIRMLVGSPELHHWHHDLDRNAGNYANISPLMDLIFGTYTCPDHEPEALGIREASPNNYILHMLKPFFLWKK